jgi:hypothetical protein
MTERSTADMSDAPGQPLRQANSREYAKYLRAVYYLAGMLWAAGAGDEAIYALRDVAAKTGRGDRPTTGPEAADPVPDRPRQSGGRWWL